MTVPDMARLLALLRPWHADVPLVRAGSPDGDGGYLIPDDLDGIGALLSIGVGDDVTFDSHFADRGIKVVQYDHTIDAPPSHHSGFTFHPRAWAARSSDSERDLAAMLEENHLLDEGDLALKFDVEGHEWAALRTVPSSLLSRFRIIVCELHSLGSVSVDGHYLRVATVLERLALSHVCVHVHPNNCCGASTIEGVTMPSVLEVTLLRRDRSTFRPAAPRPHPLDRPCVPGRDEIALTGWPEPPLAPRPCELALPDERGVYVHGADGPGFLLHSLGQWRPAALAGHPLLAADPAPLAQRSPYARDPYLVVVPQRAGPSWDWRAATNPLASLPSRVIEDVNTGLATLVVDYSNEAGSHDDVWAIEEVLSSRGVRHWERAFYVAQNRALGAGTGRLRIAAYDALMPMTALRLASLLDETGEERLGAAVHAGGRAYALCLNATPRPHRLWMCALLEHLGLIDACLVSFPEWDYVKSAGASPERVLRAMAAGPLAYLVPAAQRVLERLPLRVDEFSEVGNDLMFAVDLSAYEGSSLTIVTETGVEADVRRITEKTVKAAAMGNPFLVLGHAGSVAMIESWGFSVFGDLVDHGYDDLMSPVDRLEAIGREVVRLQGVLREPTAAVRDLLAREGARNRAWLRAGFLDRYAEAVAVPAVLSL